MTNVDAGTVSELRHSKTNRLLIEASQVGPVERQLLIDEVIVANIDVARSIARRYRNRGIATEDLEQVASLALVRAANRFDPSKADDFLTFAVPTIRGEVRRHFRDHGWTVRPPRRIQELQAAINKDAAANAGQDLSDREVALRLGVDVEQVQSARAAHGCFAPASLDTPVHEDGESLVTSLVDDEYDEHAAVEARVILRSLTQELEPRDRLILYLRFVEGLTQSEIGKELGVTQMQVSRLLSRILRDLRNELT